MSILELNLLKLPTWRLECVRIEEKSLTQQ